MTETRCPLPKMARIRQTFARPRVDDVAAEMREQMQVLTPRIRPGMTVGLTVGSRGIQNILTMLEVAVQAVRGCGASPVLLAAMGSHGGGTRQGQKDVLDSLGITEERLGAPVITCDVTRAIGETPGGLVAYMLESAFGVDAIIPINRVKLHTDFVDTIQSGMCKMLVIGLGHHKGCTAIHKADFSYFGDTLREATRLILSRAKVGFGVAIMENAYDQTLLVEAVPAGKMLEREAELVMLSRKNMPILMIPDIDVLVVEQIGKDISGNGYDPNILGKSFLLKEFVLPVPKIGRMVVLDVSPASHGSAVGIGIFDVTTRKLFDQLNMEAMYANDIALGCLDDCKIPLVAADEEEAIRVAVKVLQDNDPEKLKIVRIRDTLHMEEIQVSEDLLDVVKADPRLELLGPV